MDYVKRPDYLRKIEKFIDKPVVKILTGMRRVGKTTILKLIQNELLKRISPDNIIHINFESKEMLEIRDGASLSDFLNLEIRKMGKGKLYFFFDEIQIVSGWEEVIKDIMDHNECDIYITGSNSAMLSEGLEIHLMDRYVSFEVQPFTFYEFLKCYSQSDISQDELFRKYLNLGGMPFLRYFNLKEDPSLKYLNDVYNTVLVKDILEYNSIRDVYLLNRILLYTCENIGYTFSALGIRNYLKTEGRSATVDTVLSYLEFCQNAFILKKVPRYDITQDKILKTDEKYYLTDHGLRQAKGFSNLRDIERVLENIVFIELLARGYSINVGKIRDREIDFIAVKGEEILCIQVADRLDSDRKKQDIIEPLYDISNDFNKLVLSLDDKKENRDGVKYRNLIEWLLEKN